MEGSENLGFVHEYRNPFQCNHQCGRNEVGECCIVVWYVAHVAICFKSFAAQACIQVLTSPWLLYILTYRLKTTEF